MFVNNKKIVSLLSLAVFALVTLPSFTEGKASLIPSQTQVVPTIPTLAKNEKGIVHLKEKDVLFGVTARRGGGGGTATVSSEIFNLVKAIVGVGVLSLPAGIAAFGSAPSAVIPAMIMICVMGSLAGYEFSLIGRICHLTDATSYRSAWEKTIGDSTSWIPAVAVTSKSKFHPFLHLFIFISQIERIDCIYITFLLKKNSHIIFF